MSSPTTQPQQVSTRSAVQILPVPESGSRQASHSKLRLLPEGWVFIVILTFVALGAVLRNVNLLIILAGMMLAPLLINWRVGRQLLFKMKFQRVVPQHIHVGSFVSFQWKATNDRRSMATWNLVVEDQIVRLKVGHGDSEPVVDKSSKQLAALSFPQIDVNQSEYASYRVMFDTRGVYQIGPSVVSSAFPFGLIQTRKIVHEPGVFYVAPRLGHLSPTWDRRLRSSAFGNEALQRRRGMEEDEFYALRRWRAGDHLRHVHWRSTAKLGYPMVKEHDQRTNRDFALVLDLYGLDPESGHDDGSSARCETILSFAATVFAELGIAVQGQIGLGVCGREMEWICDRHHHELFKRLMRSLAIAQPNSKRELNSLVSTIINISNGVSSGTPIYVASTRDNPFTGGEQPTGQSGQQSSVLKHQWSMISSSVKWLSVGSKEFDELFQTSRIDDVESARQLQSRWEASDD